MRSLSSVYAEDPVPERRARRASRVRTGAGSRRWGSCPAARSWGKTSMKPSSIDDPVALVQAPQRAARPPPATTSTASTAGATTTADRPAEHERPHVGERRSTSMSAWFEQVGQAPRWYPADRRRSRLHGLSSCADVGRRPAVVRRRPDRAAASVGCTCWPGATSTIPTPAARRCTPTSSCAAGPRPGWRSPHRTSAAVGQPATRTAQRVRRGPPREPVHGVPTDDRRRDRRDGWAATTRWSRSGTACRGSRRCGAARRGSRSSTTSTGRCGTRSCPGPLAVVRAGARGPARAAVLPAEPDGRPRRTRPATSCSNSGSAPIACTAVPNGIDPMFSPGGSKTRRTRRSSPSGGWRP